MVADEPESGTAGAAWHEIIKREKQTAKNRITIITSGLIISAIFTALVILLVNFYLPLPGIEI
jgi:hypothetical protein